MLASLFVANLAFAAIAWLAGLGVERLRPSALVRVRLWTAAFLAAVAIAPGLWLVGALHIPTPWHIPAFEAKPFLPEQPPVAATASPSSPDQAAPTLQAVRPTTPPIGLEACGLALLFAGFALRLTGRLVSYRRLARVLARSEPIEDAALDARLAAQAFRLGVAAPNPRQGAISTPLVLRHPRIILLPYGLVDQLGDKGLSLVCGHELAHLKRGDDIAMAGFDLLACLFWFNPFMAAIDRRLSAAREEVCDRMAMGDVGRANRQAYAEALVSTFRLCSAAAVGPAFLGQRVNPAKQRLMAVLDPVAPSAGKTLLAAGVAVILFAGAGALSLAFAGAPPKGDPWLAVHPDGLTDADHAWLIMRSVENDIAAQRRYLAKAPDPGKMTAFIEKSQAQVAEIGSRIKGKSISLRARQIDQENTQLLDQQLADDDQWDKPPPAGKVRATVFCAPDQPCAVKSVTDLLPTQAKTYGKWAVKYAEMVRKNPMPQMLTTDGFLVKADLTPAVLTRPPDPALALNAFFGMGPEGMPLDVVPPPET